MNPVKYLTWVIKRDDMLKINEYNNYSNWVYPDIPPYSTTIANKETKDHQLSGDLRPSLRIS